MTGVEIDDRGFRVAAGVLANQVDFALVGEIREAAGLEDGFAEGEMFIRRNLHARPAAGPGRSDRRAPAPWR